MRFSFFKILVLFCVIIFICDCSDESSTKADSSTDKNPDNFQQPDTLNPAPINDSINISSASIDTAFSSNTNQTSSSEEVSQSSSSSSEGVPQSSSSSNEELPQSSSSSSEEVPQGSSSSNEEVPQGSSSSSEEVPLSSSSSSKQEIAISPSYTIKQGGSNGNGWGSRYWDCCMPHCAWGKNTSNPTKVCNVNMEVVDESIGSVCDKGNGGVCDTQAPWAVNSQFAFAFAAVPPKYGGACGKCFLLTFDGGRHNADPDENTKSLSGKKMVIMVSNIGGDVDDGQFDIMIPGGGVGLFNGCEAMLGVTDMGKQYGGFISDCKHDANCIIEKCKAFSKYPKIQAGCEFSATWMNGASNPTFKFEELESCPSEIAERW